MVTSNDDAFMKPKLKDFKTINSDLNSISPKGPVKNIGLASKFRDSVESARVGAATYHTLNASTANNNI